MARQRFYENDSTLNGLDRLTGIDSSDNTTKNFTIADIAQFFANTGIADASKLGFHYLNVDNTFTPASGQIVLARVLPDGTFTSNVDGFAFVTRIIISNQTTQGVDIRPLRRFFEGTDIKLTDTTSPNGNVYGLYDITNVDQTNNDFSVLSVRHNASSGTLNANNLVLSIIGATLSNARGSTIFDGTAVPTLGNPTAVAGDLYFQITTNPRDVRLFMFNGTAWEDEGSLIGEAGPQGPAGPTGPIGPVRGVGTTTTNTGNPGTDADVTVVANGDNADYTFTIPRGDVGERGPQGEVNVVATNTTAPGTNASVTDGNTDPGIADLTFNIPRGDVGPQGDSVDGVRTTTPGSSTQATGFTFNVNGTPIGNEIFVSPGPAGPTGAADLYATTTTLTSEQVTSINSFVQGGTAISVTLNIDAGRSYTDGQHARVGDATNYFNGLVTNHDAANGILVLQVEARQGNLIAQQYDVNLSGGTGGVGQRGPRGFSVNNVNVVSGGTTAGETTVIQFTTDEPGTLPTQVTLQPGTAGVDGAITNTNVRVDRGTRPENIDGTGDTITITTDNAVVVNGQLWIRLTPHASGPVTESPSPLLNGNRPPITLREQATGSLQTFTIRITDEHNHFRYTFTEGDNVLSQNGFNITYNDSTDTSPATIVVTGTSDGMADLSSGVVQVRANAINTTSVGSDSTVNFNFTTILTAIPAQLADFQYGFSTEMTLANQGQLNDITTPQVGNPRATGFDITVPGPATDTNLHYIYFITDDDINITMVTTSGFPATFRRQPLTGASVIAGRNVYRSPVGYATQANFRNIQITYN